MSLSVELIAHTPDPAWVIEQAASVCYNSAPTHDCKLVMQCYKSGHTSVLEHASFTFKISGISRACSHQIVRHRMASFSQRSQRYVDEDGFDYVTPPFINNNEMNLAWFDFNTAMREASSSYDILKQKIPKEDARYVLPNACETTLYMTMNLRSLINFMNERLCTRAQWEIREVAKQIKKLVVGVMPQAEQMLVPKCEKNWDYPFCPEHKSCGRHKRLKDVYDAKKKVSDNA